jgi:YHS domain-containing protein
MRSGSAGLRSDRVDGYVASEGMMVIDPVCKMQIDEKKAAGKSDYNGKTYYFCAPICKTKFDKEPQKYLEK